jgi:iron complex transport system ATP-binding protein
MSTLSFHHLSIGYNTGSRDIVIAEGLTGSLPEATLTCLIGRNGTGKSTLLRTLAGLQPPLAGEVLLNGKSLRQLSSTQRARQVSVVLTQRPEVQNLTVRELAGMGRSPYTGFFGTLHENDWKVVDEALHQVGMAGFSHRKIQTLSDGERQKVMIAKALAQQTPVIILDEPTAFLDHPSKVETMTMLQRLATEMDKTIVLSTHDIEIAERTASHFLLMTASGLETVERGNLGFTHAHTVPNPNRSPELLE